MYMSWVVGSQGGCGTDLGRIVIEIFGGKCMNVYNRGKGSDVEDTQPGG